MNRQSNYFDLFFFFREIEGSHLSKKVRETISMTDRCLYCVHGKLFFMESMTLFLSMKKLSCKCTFSWIIYFSSDFLSWRNFCSVTISSMDLYYVHVPSFTTGIVHLLTSPQGDHRRPPAFFSVCDLFLVLVCFSFEALTTFDQHVVKML